MGIKNFFFKFKNNLKSRQWKDRPGSLNIELTSVCDARCIHCSRHKMDRQMKPMDIDLFKRIIDQAAEMKVPEICPNGFGELLTINNLEDYLGYINSHKHKFKININTNANQLTDEKIELFLKEKVSMLNICLDGATHETMSQIRLKLSPSKIEENIKNLIRERNQRNLNYPKIRVGMVVMDINRHEINAFRKKWEGLVDMIGFDGYSNRGDSLEENLSSTSEFIPPFNACILPFRDLNIWSDGKAVICCNDWNEELVIGDLNKETLDQVWHSETMTNIRKAHYYNNGNSIAFCKKCNNWQNPAGRKLWY